MNRTLSPEQQAAEHWQSANDAYLEAALHWLRLSLQAAAPPPPVPASAPLPQPPVAAPAVAAAPPPRSWWSRWFGDSSDDRPVATTPAPAPVVGAATTVAADDGSAARMARATALAQAALARDSHAVGDPPPALVMLSERFGLSDFERDLLLLAAAPELDPAISGLMATLPGAARGGVGPSFALAMHSLEDPSWDVRAARRPLRRWQLIDVDSTQAQALGASGLRVDERIVNYLKGYNALDERLAALIDPAPPAAAAALAPSQQQAVQEALTLLRAAAAEGQATLQLVGHDPRSSWAVAQAVCAAWQWRPCKLALQALPAGRAEVDLLARLWGRETRLLPLALVIDAHALEDVAPERRAELVAALKAWSASSAAPLLLLLREAAGEISAPRVEVQRPTMAEQCQAWTAALAHTGEPAAVRDAAQRLAGQFALDLGQLHDAAALAGAVEADDGEGVASVADRAWQVCVNLTRPRLDLLAERITPKARWQDLVLREDSKRLLGQIVAQVRGRYRVHEQWGFAARHARGLGLAALFAGESGTGKTMAAEAMAGELDLALYRIDLSAVVSKYVGDTEKNLRRLFDAAEQGGAILFFDEADALFGKRSEVKDSHDRYANIEINYLLQRMEAFTGLAILATNMKAALDPAFMRRLRFIVQFPFPGPEQRQAMWAQAFPSAAQLDEIDTKRLARFALSGGNIHSIALNAAFMAPADGRVTQAMLLQAVRGELHKLDKPIVEAEFR
jgi:hypothetical protein